MTIKEGIYDIRESLNAYSIDEEISNRHIYYLMNTYRRQVIRQHIKRNPGEFRDQLTQTLYYTIENVNESRFPEFFTTDYIVRRTSKKIPLIVGEQIYKDIVVRPLTRLSQEIEVINKARAHEIQYAPKGFIYAYVDDDRYLYVIGPVDNLSNFLDKITVTAILEDPKDIEDINSLTADLVEYPLTGNLWTQVRALVLQNLAPKLSVSIDTINNNNDDSQTQA